ncbi:hypothetical protein E5288_WYG019808 [Bos mutus]|uniref:Uncharacterized protein n=1 Tax=Bos mutus TaxID=72004 RepID=A0A6B0RTE5_9CETA|nr:hypothetical protein [Bos mutus]
MSLLKLTKMLMMLIQSNLPLRINDEVTEFLLGTSSSLKYIQKSFSFPQSPYRASSFFHGFVSCPAGLFLQSDFFLLLLKGIFKDPDTKFLKMYRKLTNSSVPY